MLPYPQGCNMVMLYVQDTVLMDKVHADDVPYLEKARKVLEAVEADNFDIFA
jgi:hypothetical protein